MIKKENKEIKKNEKTQIQPIHDKVLIKESLDNKEKKTNSGIIIPVTVKEDKGSKCGIVISVGNGHYENGNLIPMTVKKGDKVLFQWGDKITIEDNEYYIVKEGEILAIIN